MDREAVDGRPCTWVGAFVYSHENDENIFVGALRFSGENLVLGRKVASFVEVYGRQIPVEEIPKVTVTFGNLWVNGTPVEKPSATAVYPKRIPDYAEAVAENGQLVVKVGEQVPDRKERRVELSPVKQGTLRQILSKNPRPPLENQPSHLPCPAGLLQSERHDNS